ncbi:MAG: phospho-N-acetylmuramoyl-pentapeptide-transferase, partial [Clostridia bacterium]|nr:phospho-N-acetylmuramoyl-pentapeptide-transferase [Clostridia bacterium]
TDGIDGLASSVTAVTAAFFAAVAFTTGLWSLGILAAATIGGCVGFLVYNFYPARVFMGDTGSLFLGGLVVGMAFLAENPLIVVTVGLVYLLETLSVMLQVTYFKLTHGKRLFKMSPIHHHFEKCGWSEIKIVAVFSAVTLVLSFLTYFLDIL